MLTATSNTQLSLKRDNASTKQVSLGRQSIPKRRQANTETFNGTSFLHKSTAGTWSMGGVLAE